MPKYAVSDLNGKITKVIEGPTAYIEVGSGEDVDDTTHYVLNGKVVEKQKINYSVVKENMAIVLGNLPVGIYVECDMLGGWSESHSVKLEFDTEGPKTIYLSDHAAYLDEEIEVTVEDNINQ